MDSYCLRFSTDGLDADLLLARLADFPFYAFQEEEETLEAFLPASDWTGELQDALHALGYPFTAEHLPARNWNTLWEQEFQPIRVGTFCGIRADFHPPMAGVEHELLIQPKMAFGTGHHATTYMMIDLMRTLDFAGTKVLDYGCGTGILAILAARMGCSEATAVDIETAAWENTLENAAKNGVADRILALEGTLEAVTSGNFDVVPANINRNVLLDTLPALNGKIRKGGRLLMSGILKTDRSLLLEAAATAGFELKDSRERGEWVALLFAKH